MGNITDTLKGQQKALSHPHLDQQISQAMQYGNPILLSKIGHATINEILRHIPQDSTDPRHAYCYFGALLDASPEIAYHEDVHMLEQHPNSVFAYLTSCWINSCPQKIAVEMISLPLKNSSKVLGELAMELVRNSGTDVSELKCSYPTEFPSELAEHTPDQHLIWLIMGDISAGSMKIPEDAQLAEKWITALVNADAYVHDQRLASIYYVNLFSKIISRWHYLREVAPNYLMEVVMPYYHPLMTMYYRHNFFNMLVKADIDLLQLVYQGALGWEGFDSSWTSHTPLYRSISCLPERDLFTLLGLKCRDYTQHPRQRELLVEHIILLDQENLDLEVNIEEEQYHGISVLENMDRTVTIHNIHDRQGKIKISKYNPADILVIYDSKLETKYFFPIGEVAGLVKDGINPYNEEKLDEGTLTMCEEFVAMHNNRSLELESWHNQWLMIINGWCNIHISPWNVAQMHSQYVTNSELPLGKDGKYHFDISPSDVPDEMQLQGALEQIMGEITDKTPMADQLRGVFGGLSDLMSAVSDQPASSSKVALLDDAN